MNPDLAFKNIVVVGLGLIGGSILQTLKSQSYAGNTYGIDSNASAISKAKEMSLIANKDQNIETDLQNVLVIFSVPTLSITKAIDDLNLSTGDILYTDTCSVKSSVLEDINRRESKFVNKFIPSHPIAGSEKSGLVASTSTLFDNRLTIVCPHEKNEEDDIKKIEAFWNNLGSVTKRLPAKNHDELFAKTSHLPHVISYALMDSIFKDLSDETFLYSGGSLESYTRIASSDPLMWKDIMIANEKSIVESIENFKESLDILLEMIKKKDSHELINFFTDIKKSRDELLSDDKN
jgi:prephenate dehydrogenase